MYVHVFVYAMMRVMVMVMVMAMAMAMAMVMMMMLIIIMITCYVAGTTGVWMFKIKHEFGGAKLAKRSRIGAMLNT